MTCTIFLKLKKASWESCFHRYCKRVFGKNVHCIKIYFRTKSALFFRSSADKFEPRTEKNVIYIYTLGALYPVLVFLNRSRRYCNVASCWKFVYFWHWLDLEPFRYNCSFFDHIGGYIWLSCKLMKCVSFDNEYIYYEYS